MKPTNVMTAKSIIRLAFFFLGPGHEFNRRSRSFGSFFLHLANGPELLHEHLPEETMWVKK